MRTQHTASIKLPIRSIHSSINTKLLTSRQVGVRSPSSSLASSERHRSTILRNRDADEGRGTSQAELLFVESFPLAAPNFERSKALLRLCCDDRLSCSRRDKVTCSVSSGIVKYPESLSAGVAAATAVVFRSFFAPEAIGFVGFRVCDARRGDRFELDVACFSN